MLKAVRFDEDNHKHLLNFINDFTDEKGRKNESEAIRFLMQKGFEVLNGLPAPQKKPANIDINILKTELMAEMSSLLKPNQTEINVEALKTEIRNEILSQVNKQTFDGINNIIDKLNNIQPTIVTENPQFTKVNASKPDIIPTKKVDIPADADGLLGNLLANANR